MKNLPADYAKNYIYHQIVAFNFCMCVEACLSLRCAKFHRCAVSTFRDIEILVRGTKSAQNTSGKTRGFAVRKRHAKGLFVN